VNKVMVKTFFGSTALSELTEDGFWKVTCDMEEALKGETGTPWDSRRISVMSIDRDRERAYKTASEAVTKKFEQLKYNLFTLPKEESANGYPNPVKDYKAESSESDSN